ncbi:MAG: alpha/beta hydrolase [Bacteroidota bacterium]|nr:alpha/beta hydrolase [Bacteroidota bacterium]
MFRLIVSIFLLLLSFLVIFKAPTNFFWRVAVAVTEFPWIFIIAALILFASCFWADKFKLVSLAISGAALLLYSWPVLCAYQRGAELEANFSSVFPSSADSNQLEQPFSFSKMFSGIGKGEIIPQRMVYKTLPSKELALDFYTNAETKKLPCIIVIHGGSWSQGDMKQLPALNSYLANKEYRVASISYRLAPEFKSPAPAEDTKDAIDFLTQNAEKLGIDTNNFILLGRSAGGQIALVTAYTLNDPRIRGVISFYAPADMVWGAKIKGNPLVLNTDKVFAAYLGGSFEEVPEKYYESSACEYVNPNSTPTLIIHGNIDAMVSFHHSERLKKKLDDNKVKNYFLDLPASTHGCDYNLSGPGGQLSTFAVERFIGSVLNR